MQDHCESLFSLIETAKANSVEPYAYLRHLFTELPKATTAGAIQALLPSIIKKDQISNCWEERWNADGL